MSQTDPLYAFAPRNESASQTNWTWSRGGREGKLLNRSKWPPKVPKDPEKILIPSIQCTLCNKVVPSNEVLLAHTRQEKHIRLVNARQQLAVTETEKKNVDMIFRCILCNLTLTQDKVGSHLTSFGHKDVRKRKREEQQAIVADPGKKLKPAGCVAVEGGWKCTICNSNPMTLNGILSHIDGRKHQKQVNKSKEEKKNKFLLIQANHQNKCLPKILPLYQWNVVFVKLY